MTARPESPEPAPGIEPWAPDPAIAPDPDPDAEPAGFIVAADGDVRLHFHDWGAARRVTASAIGSARLLLPGLLQPAWSWAPVARRLARAVPVGRRRPARPGAVRRADGRL